MNTFDAWNEMEKERKQRKENAPCSEWNALPRLTCRDPEGRARLMPDVDLMAAIERLCQIEERGKGVLIMPRAEQQIAVSAGLKRKWKERRSGNASQ
jgi:hypothetical protein